MSSMNKKIAQDGQDVAFILAHHDSQITSLGNRMTGVENKLDDVASVMHKIDNKITAQAAQPHFNIDKVVSLVKDISIMIGMAVAAIIWVTTGQFSGPAARQDETNKQVVKRLDGIENLVQDKIGWLSRVDPRTDPYTTHTSGVRR